MHRAEYTPESMITLLLCQSLKKLAKSALGYEIDTSKVSSHWLQNTAYYYARAGGAYTSMTCGYDHVTKVTDLRRAMKKILAQKNIFYISR